MTVEAPTRPATKPQSRAPGICTTAAAPALPRTYTLDHVHTAMLGKSTRTIQRWRITLGFPAPKVLGTGSNGSAVYLADEVDAWIAKRLGVKA